jgi:hypothetical protein
MTVSESNKINDLSSVDVSTECDMTLRLAECLRDYVVRHGDSGQPFVVLAALATLTIDRIREEKYDVRFTASNIAAQAGLRVPDDKQPGTVLSPYWNKLDAALGEREEGIQDFARRLGLPYYPWPKKDTSKGGRSANSMYYVESRLLPDDNRPSLARLVPGEIAYIRELTPRPSWWAQRFMKNGYRLEGWRRGLVMLYGASILTVGGLSLAFFFWILFVKFAALPGAVFAKLFLSFGLLFAVLWLAFLPFSKLFSWRIVMAPAFLISIKEENVQMEIIREPHPTARNSATIRLIRYAGTCPICEAKVELAEGGREFPNRLIGRCRENPAEHVYSFDRSTCRGRSLR